MTVKRVSGRFKTSQRARRYPSSDDYPDPQENAGSLIMSPIGQPLWGFPETNERDAFWGIIPVVSVPGNPDTAGADVAFITVIDFSVTFTVHATNPAADYKTIGAALEYASRFKAAYLERWADEITRRLTVEVNILSGHVVDEQIHNYVDLSFVNLTAEDYEVLVNEAALTEVSQENFKLKAFIANYGTARSPVINTNFVSNGVGVPGTGYKSAGLYVGGNAWSSAQSATIVAGEPVTEKPWGFNKFDVNIHNAGHFEGYRGKFDEADDIGLVNRGKGIIGSCSAIGCANKTIQNNADLRIVGIKGGQDDLFPGIYTQDYRKTAGVDDPDDIHTTENGTTHIENLLVRGGINVVPNSFTGGAICYDDRVPASPKVIGQLALSNGASIATVTSGSFEPVNTNLIDLGSGTKRFRSGYFSGNLTVSGAVTANEFYGELVSASGSFTGSVSGTGSFSTLAADSLTVDGVAITPPQAITTGDLAVGVARILALTKNYGTFLLELVDTASGTGVRSAIFTYDVSSAALVRLCGHANLVATTGALTGTTGSPGDFTLSCHGGALHVENRIASEQTFRINWFR